jgi:type I restriction enzyme, S subunit
VSWPAVSIGEIVADLRSGFASGDDDPEGIVQFRMNNVERSGELNWNKLRRVPQSKARKDLLVHPGDILFNATNSPDLVGKTALFTGFDEPVTFSNHFLRLRSKREKAHPAYLARWLQREFAHGRFAGMCRSWVNQASITKDQLASLEIPLPTLDEQRRIAAILDKADALRRKRKRALGLLNRLTQSVFASMFGDLVATQQFPRGAVGQWVADFETGKNLAPDPDDLSLGYRVLKVSAVTSGNFDPDESKPLPADYIPPTSHLVQKGDLLFSRANTEELIGATALVERSYKKLVLPDKIWRFAWSRTNTPDPIFIRELFRSAPFRREISKRATGTSGSMKNISKEKVLQIGVGMPSRERQAAFSDIANQNDMVIACMAGQLAKLEQQFSSLQHRAFTGQL